jgi:hypothetical protein
MEYVAPKTDYKVNQIGHFKQLVAGAGAKVFKVNDSGVFAGAASYGSAPFKLSYAGALTATGANITGTVNATAGSITGDLLVGTALGESVLIKGSTGKIVLQYNNTAKGTITGYINQAHSEDSYIRLSAISGRTLTLMESMIECGGNFNPASDFGSSLGQSALRWNDVYAKSIIAHGTGAKFSINGSDGQDESFAVVTNTRMDGSTLQHKKITMTFSKGIITNLSSESDWENA